MPPGNLEVGLDNRIDRDRIESIVRERLQQEGASPEEIDSAIRELRAGRTAKNRGAKGDRWEYRSGMRILGLPLFHIVIGRDPETGRVGKALGVIAIGRVAFGVLPIGQVAIGILPIGQLAIGVLFAFGQAAFAGYDALGQVAVASHFAAGQLAAAISAIGQFAVGRFVICQVGWGQYVWSTKVKDPEALQHFREMFGWLLDAIP